MKYLITAINEDTKQEIQVSIELINSVLKGINNASVLPGQTHINLTPKTFSTVIDKIFNTPIGV